jgi:hypothetical protein
MKMRMRRKYVANRVGAKLAFRQLLATHARKIADQLIFTIMYRLVGVNPMLNFLDALSEAIDKSSKEHADL